MILVLDLGNTNLYIGVFKDETLIKTIRTSTDINKSSDEYVDVLANMLVRNNWKSEEFDGAIISSVVPTLTSIIKEAIRKIFGFLPLVLGSKLRTGLPIRIDHPNELGADLVSDAVGAVRKHGVPLVIADMGTATKLVVVDATGALVGVVLMAGIKVAMQALVNNTAQLMETNLEAPRKVIGKNTVDSMNSGAIYGTVNAIKGLTKDIEKELGYDCKHVLTGGYARLIAEEIKDAYVFDPFLILEGLYEIYRKNEVR